MLSTPDFPHKYKLNWVNVITVNTQPYLQPWIDTIVEAGAILENHTLDEDISNLLERVSQKVAIIIDEIDPEKIQVIIKKYGDIFSSNENSLRFVLFMKDGQSVDIQNDRIHTIQYRAHSLHDCIENISSALYKARLPVKLREWFDVEITDEILELEQVRYRKIIVRTYIDKDKKELKYKTTGLYIHNKQLYEMTDKEMKLSLEEGDNPLVHVQCWRMSGYVNLISQFMDKKA